MPAPRQSVVVALLIASFSLGVGGCYDSEALVERVRNKALRTRLDEVELGSFRVTLPRDTNSGEMTEIDIHLFAESQRYKINEIQDEIQAKQALVQDEALRTLRDATRKELIDPQLRGLRERLLESINVLIEGEPLVSIGISDVRFIRH